MEAADVQCGVVGQVYVGQGGTSSVDIGVHPVDGGGVNVSPGQDGGDGDPGEGEGVCSFLCHSPHTLCHSLLLGP